MINAYIGYAGLNQETMTPICMAKDRGQAMIDALTTAAMLGLLNATMIAVAERDFKDEDEFTFLKKAVDDAVAETMVKFKIGKGTVQ